MAGSVCDISMAATSEKQVLLYFLGPKIARLMAEIERGGSNTRRGFSAPESHRQVTQQGQVWCWHCHAKPVARQWEALHSLNNRQQNLSTS